MSIKEQLMGLASSLPKGVTLVAISKTYPPEAIMEAYRDGQRIFGESRPQEMKAKYEALPKDIEWHMIGHLQTNKVKYIAPFVTMIHSVDSLRLLEVIDKEAEKNGRIMDVLLEVHVAREETKHGWTPEELDSYIAGGHYKDFPNVRIRGIMGIASLTYDREQVKGEFMQLHDIFSRLRRVFGEEFDTLSMGMTSDWEIAVECGSTMVRIGSLIFGARSYD